jgi:hypothetical protein
MPSSLKRGAMAFRDKPSASKSATIGSNPSANDRVASESAAVPLPGFRFV